MGEDPGYQVKEVIHLLIRADNLIANIHRDIGGAHQHTTHHGIHQHDATIAVFEKDLTPIARLQERLIIEHNV